MSDKKDLAKQGETTEIEITDQEGKAITITREMVRNHLCPKATDNEIFMFLNIARAYNLNPFKREIHLVKYSDKPASFIVGYESYLKRAERTGLLDGWKCWIVKEGDEEKAIIEIKRKDQGQPIHWEVDRKEFDRKQASWNLMPNFMLKKVAIAQGFRLAFPEDLGGMPYIAEEVSDKESGKLSKDETRPGSSKKEIPNGEYPDEASAAASPDKSHAPKSADPTPEHIAGLAALVESPYVLEFERYMLNAMLAKKISDKYVLTKIEYWTKEIATRAKMDEENPNDCIKYLDKTEADLKAEYPKQYKEFEQK